MALAFLEVLAALFGHRRVKLVTVTFDNSYPTGGEAITPSDFGLQEIDAIFAELGDTGYVVRYDKTNKKLMVYYGNYDAATDGPLIEVPNATDLSTLDVTLMVIGI